MSYPRDVRRGHGPALNWRPGMVDLAEKRWREGVAVNAIAHECGVTKNQVIGVAHRRNWPARPSPIRRPNDPLVYQCGPKPRGPRPPAPKPRPPVLAVTLPSLASDQPSVSTPPKQEPPVIVQSAHQTPPPPKPAVVTWLSGTRYGCQWMHGERGDYRACGEPVAQLGGSWCQHHRAVVYVRRSMPDAAD